MPKHGLARKEWQQVVSKVKNNIKPVEWALQSQRRGTHPLPIDSCQKNTNHHGPEYAPCLSSLSQSVGQCHCVQIARNIAARHRCFFQLTTYQTTRGTHSLSLLPRDIIEIHTSSWRWQADSAASTSDEESPLNKDIKPSWILPNSTFSFPSSSSSIKTSKYQSSNPTFAPREPPTQSKCLPKTPSRTLLSSRSPPVVAASLCK